VARLKAYKERLILLPRKSNAPKKGDTKTDVSQLDKVSSIAAALPIAHVSEGVSEISKSEIPAGVEGGAYTKLRIARSNARYQGARDKRARDKAEAESAKK
jgi:large subunit ribosomal protein L13e